MLALISVVLPNGALWDGRYKSSLVQTETYLLLCYRYCELNPVRAAIVEGPTDYRCSSYRSNALGQPEPVLAPHRLYLSLVVPQPRSRH